MGGPVNPGDTRHHPRWYRRRIPIFWWLGKVSYTRFIIRELTSLAVGYAALVLVLQVWCLARGPESYDRFVSWLQLRPVVALHIVVLGVLVYHSATWLSLAPKALVLRLAGRRLPGAVVLSMHYAGWLVASAAVLWLLLAG
jgi:fumarate reductase subunit C